MTAVKTASDRIPLKAMERIIETAMDGLDLTHSAEWVRPPECPCHAGAQSCLLPMEAGSCQGYAAEIDTPPAHVVTAGHLLSVLPVPDTDGTVDAREAALSLIQVIESRLPFPYTLRRDHLRDRLVAASEEYEQQAGLTDSDDAREDAGPWMPRCQWCSQPCRDKRARYCCGSHRQQAYKKRRREQG